MKMFERFTERARSVIVAAEYEASTMGHTYLGTEHILLGLMAESEGLAAKVLDHLDVQLEAVRAGILHVVGLGPEITKSPLPMTPRAKKVCELALRDALSLGHNYIGTEHILLGLVREQDGVGVSILRGMEIKPGDVRNEVIRMLSGPGRTDLEPTGVLKQVRDVKSALIEAQSFALAAELRDVERTLVRQERELKEAVEAADQPVMTVYGDADHLVAAEHALLLKDLREALGVYRETNAVTGNKFTWDDMIEMANGIVTEWEELQHAIGTATKLTDVDEIRTVLHEAMGWDKPRLIQDGERMAGNGLEAQLLSILGSHAGESGESEGAVAVLERIIFERDELMHFVAELEEDDAESCSDCDSGYCQGGCMWGDPVTSEVREESYDGTRQLLQDIMDLNIDEALAALASHPDETGLLYDISYDVDTESFTLPLTLNAEGLEMLSHGAYDDVCLVGVDGINTIRYTEKV
jgi:hypothetical protein